MQGLIASNYLTGKSLKRFESIRQTVVEAYEQVINSLIDKSVLPYYPTLYPTPFMLVKEYRIGSSLARRYFYSITYPDANDFNKYAIYSTLNFLDRFPNYLVGGIGHEIAHVIVLKGRVEITKDGIVSVLRDRLSYIEAQEVSGESAYVYFAESTRAIIKEWNAIN